MADHVTDEQIDDFRHGRLADPERRSFTQHLTECRSCSGRAARHPSVAGAAAVLDDDIAAIEHPDLEELFDYVDGEVAEARAAAIEDHLRDCARCAEDVADASRERERIERTPQRTWLAVAAAVIVAVIGGAWWFARHESQTAPRPAAVVHRSPAVVDEARRSGTVAMPAALLDLRGTGETLRGSTAPVTDFDMRPAGTVVTSDRPEFSWNAPAGLRFVVTVMCNKAITAVSGPVADRKWTPPNPLPRGSKCVWQLDRLPEHTIIPQPSAPQPSFRVLDAASLASIEHAGGDDFTTGVLYAHAGAQQEALAHLGRWAASHPNDAAARSVLESVRRW